MLQVCNGVSLAVLTLQPVCRGYAAHLSQNAHVGPRIDALLCCPLRALPSKKGRSSKVLELRSPAQKYAPRNDRRKRSQAQNGLCTAQVGGDTLGAGAKIEDSLNADTGDLWLSQELARLRSMQKGVPGDGLVLTRGRWNWEMKESNQYRLRGYMEFHNVTSRFEVFVPELSADVKLLSNASLAGVSAVVQVFPRHPNNYPKLRPDGYWQAYILQAGGTTTIEVAVDIIASEGAVVLDALQAARVDINYIAYGPHGRTQQAQHVILPLSFPPPPQTPPLWRTTAGGAQVLPIPTHLLCHMDDPVTLIRKYVLPHAQPGDVVAIGETPLAIMQGRMRHPQSVRPSLIARLACLCFHPTSSLATACGMQVLVDIVGRLRIIFAVAVAIVSRFFGKRGMFYNLAGEQARLIDDVSGTLPPYDQFIVLGPVNVQQSVDAVREKTGVEMAIVDVNDLKKVQILAASRGVDHAALTESLLDNPAGNSDEQTPLVLVRPLKHTIKVVETPSRELVELSSEGSGGDGESVLIDASTGKPFVQ